MLLQTFLSVDLGEMTKLIDEAKHPLALAKRPLEDITNCLVFFISVQV